MHNQSRLCPHRVDGLTCPACAQIQFDEHVAVQLAARDPETVESLRREFDDWMSSLDAIHAEAGEPVTEVMS